MDNLPDSDELSPASIFNSDVLPEPLAPEIFSISPEFSFKREVVKEFVITSLTS